MRATVRSLGAVFFGAALSFAATYTTPGSWPGASSPRATALRHLAGADPPCGSQAWWNQAPDGGISVTVEEPPDATAVTVKTPDGERTRQSGRSEPGESLRRFTFPYMSPDYVRQVLVSTENGTCAAAPTTLTTALAVAQTQTTQTTQT
jgi:hypothetical protein